MFGNGFFRVHLATTQSLARDSLLNPLKSVLGIGPKSNGAGRNDRPILPTITKGKKL